MVTKEEIRIYIIKYNKQFTKDSIYNKLVLSGAKQVDIDSVYFEINNPIKKEKKNIFKPKSPYQWLGFVALIIGIINGGGIGGTIAVIISKLDKKENSTIKKITLSFLTVIVGLLIFFLVFSLLQGLVSSNITSSICESFSGDEADECYINAAQNEKNATLCNLISKQSGNFNTKDSCYSNLAEILQNSDLCENIEVIQIKSTIGTRDTCYANLAVALNKIDLCENIVNEEISVLNKDLCYLSIAVTYNNPLICEKILVIYNENIEIASKNFCYASIGIQTTDSSLCDKAGSFKQTCLELI